MEKSSDKHLEINQTLQKNQTFGFHIGFPLNISMILNGIPM